LRGSGSRAGASGGDHAESADAAARALLGGVAGASARLVTAAPGRKRALRYTFNASLRAARLGAGLEDETDDEAADDRAGSGLVGDEGATGAHVTADVVESFGAVTEDAETDSARLVEEAGMKKAPGKPVPKRGMGPRFREWADKDLSQPLTAGLFAPAFDGRRALRPATARVPGRTTLHASVGGGGSVFARLAREESRR